MFTFITCGYEHSIANMCGLMLGLLLPHHGMAISAGGYAYNLALATLGNIIGGAIFVAAAYWLASPKARPVVASVAVSEPVGMPEAELLTYGAAGK
jgi:nitrite transporter NirC